MSLAPLAAPVPETVPVPRGAPALMRGRTERATVLLWVRSGAAHLETVHGGLRIEAGTAASVPAGLAYQLRTETDAVVVPVIHPAAVPVASPLTPVEIDDALGDWLMWCFARSLGFLAAPRPEPLDLDHVTEFAHGGAREVAPVSHVVLYPPMPRSRTALQIARGVLRDPRNQDALATIAATHAVSVRSVEHHFSRDTGLSFGRWRTAVRIGFAAQLLEQGHDIGWVAERSGFRTASGFTKAFRARTGVTPSGFTRQRRASRSPVPSHSPAPHHHSLGDALRGGVLPTTSPVIPSATSWERINDFHVLVWMFRGDGCVTIGDRAVRLQSGDALWLPARMRNRVNLDAGAILLPLGSVPGSTNIVPPPARAVRLPDAAEGFLLHSSVANYSWMRPHGHDAFRVTRWFLSAIAPGSGPVVGRPSPDAAVIAAATRAHPEAGTDIDEWASALSVPRAQLAAAFRSAYGQPFVRWRAQLRMTLARQYLQDGMTVREVAERVGYAHPPAFSRAFSAHHGVSPKRYRADAAESVSELLVR